ncbi:glycosyltransferase family 2 protein [Marivirga sp.]|uniref:glycosyltransferase family 2 protein n=1 Tax=Marivirga sp. TaxID=2018662 RepID=UPI0025EF875D|nr:glycosyltransferase family 2 protein [Marivirga sp.]
MKRIYCIIVTYNGLKWINQCLGSLKSPDTPFKTIVIDNGSTDGTQEAIKTKFPEVDLIQSENNLGFGKANNVGIKKAYEKNADYIFLLNQDAWVDLHTLSRLIEVAESNPSFGILSPMHLNGRGGALDFKFANYIDPQKCPGFISDLYLQKVKSLYEVRFINAAAWLLRRETIKKVGLFDELFFLYGEDTNYISRLRFHQFKLGIVSNAVIYHDREIRKGSKNPTGLALEHQNKFQVGLLDINNPSLVKSYLFNTRVLIAKLLKGIVSNRDFFRIFFKMLKLRKEFIKSRKRNKQLFIQN